VDAVNEGMAQEAEKPRPQRRVEPLVKAAEKGFIDDPNVIIDALNKVGSNGHYDAVPSNEEAWQ